MKTYEPNLDYSDVEMDTEDQPQIDFIEAKYGSWAKVDEVKKELAALEDRISDLQHERDTMERDLDQANALIEELRETIEDLEDPDRDD